MIRLTHESGKSIYINPDKIVDIFSTETGHAQLLFAIGEGYRVTESPEEVASKIMEYKLAMAEYRALSEKLESSDCDKRLRRLTGLEDNQDG